MTTAARPDDNGTATPAVGIPLDRHVGRLEPERDGFAAWWREHFAEATPQDESFVEAERCAEIAWNAGIFSERKRWEAALRLTWGMVDPFHPAGEPGSYWRGQDAGIVAALATLRMNLKPPNSK